ncbi:MAG: alanine racemase [Bacteroidota bacterium]|nr:alanine racemase [Bacteroidota bacterium]
MSAPVPHAGHTRALIHSDRMRSNLATIRSRMPGLDVMGVVKANAYGHDAVLVSSILVDEGVKHLGVATLQEALDLREAGVEANIMVFAPLAAEWVNQATEACLDVVVDSQESLDVAGRTKGRLRCHLKVDTGMGRLGRGAEESETLLRGIERHSSLDLGSVWTHLARADEPEDTFTDLQLDRFDSFIEAIGGAPAPLHVAASAAVFAHPRAIDPTRYSLARTGIALYGLLDLPGHRPPEGLVPVMEFVSRITHLKRVEAGTPISYGSRWHATEPTWIATVGAGYADGVSRHLSNKGRVRIGDQSYPIVGTVCMDMFMVDLGPDPREVQVGQNVSLFGASPPTAFEMADQTDSITYVPVCAVSSRVPRLQTCYSG